MGLYAKHSKLLRLSVQEKEKTAHLFWLFLESIDYLRTLHLEITEILCSQLVRRPTVGVLHDFVEWKMFSDCR